MRLDVALIPLALGLALAQPAGAWTLFQPGPICRRTDVLDVVGRDLRSRIAHAELDRLSAWEQPTANEDVVSCGVCLQVKVYDMPALGPKPVRTCQLHRFDVTRVRGGYVVSNVE